PLPRVSEHRQRRERVGAIVVSALREPGRVLHGRDRARRLDAELQPVAAQRPSHATGRSVLWIGRQAFPMAASAVLVIVVAAGEASGAATSAMLASAESALATGTSVRLVEV